MRLLYYLPNRTMGAPPPPASQATSAGLVERLEDMGVDVEVCASGRVGGPFLPDDGNAPESLVAAVAKARPDVVFSYVNWNRPEHDRFRVGLEELGVPYVENVSMLPWDPSPEMGWATFLAEARHVADEYPRLPVRYLRPFVPCMDVGDSLPGLGTKRLLYMHNPEKGLAYCADLAARLGMEMVATLTEEQVAAKCGGVPGHVSCVGIVRGDTKRRLMASCDGILYSPGDEWREAIGMSPIECMLSGLPVVGVVRGSLGWDASVYQYIRDGRIPAVLAGSAEELAEVPWPEPADVRTAARCYFDNDRAAHERVSLFMDAWSPSPTVGLLLLSRGRHGVLRKTLRNWADSGLLEYADQRLAFFQEMTEEDVKIARMFGFECFGSPDNIGIGQAWKRLASRCWCDQVLTMENDWKVTHGGCCSLVHQASELVSRREADVVRLRSRERPGEPMHSRCFIGREADSDDALAHLLNCLHWKRDPHLDHPQIRKRGRWFFTSSEYANFTNNPCLYDRLWFLDNVVPFCQGGGIALEGDIEKPWRDGRHRVAQGEGCFTHEDKE